MEVIHYCIVFLFFDALRWIKL